MSCLKEKNKNSKLKLPLRAYILYLLLITFALSGITFSRYIASSSGDDSARVAVIKNLDITETGNFTEPQNWVIAPGADITKKAVVNFEGSEMACYVFLKIDAPKWTHDANHRYTYSDNESGDEFLSWNVSGGWNYLCDDGSDEIFYTAVKPNTPFSADIVANDGQIKVSDSITKSDLDGFPSSLGLTFEAAAVQYGGFNEGNTESERAIAAWNAVKNK